MASFPLFIKAYTRLNTTINTRGYDNILSELRYYIIIDSLTQKVWLFFKPKISREDIKEGIFVTIVDFFRLKR
jgi:hypothetical protein